jgi:hypothetical protein
MFNRAQWEIYYALRNFFNDKAHKNSVMVNIMMIIAHKCFVTDVIFSGTGIENSEYQISQDIGL